MCKALRTAPNIRQVLLKCVFNKIEATLTSDLEEESQWGMGGGG